jgi:hypothetical protein
MTAFAGNSGFIGVHLRLSAAHFPASAFLKSQKQNWPPMNADARRLRSD